MSWILAASAGLALVRSGICGFLQILHRTLDYSLPVRTPSLLTVCHLHAGVQPGLPPGEAGHDGRVRDS